MRRVIGVCALAVMVGCGGGGAGTSAHPDGASDTADHPEAVTPPGDGDADASLDEAATDAGADGAAGSGDVAASDADASSGGDGEAGDAAGADTASDGGGEAATDAAEAPAPRFVTVAFTGQVATVAGTPLGLDGTARLAPVSGSFSYDLGLLDKQPDPKRGLYWNIAGTTFTLTTKGHTVTGSGKAIVETENLDPDTFRFLDGPQLGDPTVRTMRVDGADAPALKLSLAITDTSGAMLTSDALPDPFPTLDIAHADGGFNISHTFSLMDAGGTLLMQLDTLANQ